MDNATAAEAIEIIGDMSRKLDEIHVGMREIIASSDRAIAHVAEATGSLDQIGHHLDELHDHPDRLG